MPGLLSQKPGEPMQGQPEAGTPMVGEQGEPGGSGVSPEEQAQYDEFVANGVSLMSNKEGLSQLAASLQGDGNPVEGLANTVVAIVTRLQSSAEKKGINLSSDVIMHGGVEIMEQAASMSSESGLHDFTDEEMEQALFLAMDNYRVAMQEEGKLPQDQMAQDLQELQAAEQNGQLEQMFPGIGEVAGRANSAAQTAAQPPQGPPAGPSGGLMR